MLKLIPKGMERAVMGSEPWHEIDWKVGGKWWLKSKNRNAHGRRSRLA